MTINKNLNIDKKYIILIFLAIITLFSLSFFTMNEVNPIEEELSISGHENYNKLVINEYMSSTDTIIDEAGNTYEWIELYNGNNSDVNLKNYALSDDEKKIKWVFPDTVIEAKSYLIVYLTKTAQEGLYAPFKLKSSGGEVITLIKPSGKVIDAVKTIPLDKGMSAARDLNGKWIITDTPTPNYVNTKEGYNNFLSFKNVEGSSIKINEILPKNSGNFMINNKFYGYVELINESNEAVDLNNYYLSNEVNRLYKYKLNATIEANSVLLIYMGSGNDSNYYSDFSLDSKNGTVYLSNNYGIIDSLEYDLSNGMAYVRTDGTYEETSIISPGYLNNTDGVLQFQKEYLVKPKTLIINEVMSNNTSYLAQNGYNFYDWIELYNNSDSAINLSDYSLTTTTNDKQMYILPNVTLQPNSYYILMASGDINLTNKSYHHTNFKISNQESLYLYKNLKIVDSVMISNIPINYSYGRGDYGWDYIETPTPLKKNNVGKKEISYLPLFSSQGGIYNNQNDLTLEILGHGDIYYTLDGSNPTAKSIKYTNPIKISKTTVVKAMSLENNKYKSDVVTSSYIVNENHTLPVVSMTLNKADHNKLIANKDYNVEVAGYIEYYDEDGSFKIPCSVALFGGQARYLNKKSYGIRFKSEYGASKLVYNLFDNRDTSVYESIVLRSGSQDYERAFFRDMLGTSLVDTYTNVDTQANKLAILYINGEYYGLYNILEKVNDDFIANHYNVDPDKLNMIQGKGEVKDGSKAFYNNAINYVNSHNMTLKESYDGLKELIDMENFIDYFIAQLYSTNNDIINIRYFSHPDIDNGKMKMILFDMDYAFYNYSNDYYYFLTNPNGMNTRFHVDNTLLIKLFKNEYFRKDFLERLSYNLKTTWNKENILNKFDEIYNKIYPEMTRNQKRWNLSFDEWVKQCEKLKNYFINRQDYLLKQTKAYFNLNENDYNYYFGGIV